MNNSRTRSNLYILTSFIISIILFYLSCLIVDSLFFKFRQYDINRNPPCECKNISPCPVLILCLWCMFASSILAFIQFRLFKPFQVISEHRKYYMVHIMASNMLQLIWPVFLLIQYEKYYCIVCTNNNVETIIAYLLVYFVLLLFTLVKISTLCIFLFLTHTTNHRGIEEEEL